jgi:hypothetical protein
MTGLTCGRRAGPTTEFWNTELQLQKRAGEIASPLFLRTVPGGSSGPTKRLYSGSVGSLNSTVSLMLP